jgi:hypothetical protein
MVGRDDEAEAVEDIILAQMFLIDPQHVGRGGSVNLGVVVKAEAVHFAQITRFTDPQDRRFDEAVETAKQVGR